MERSKAASDESLRYAAVDRRAHSTARAQVVVEVIESVTLVLERAGRPMRAREIHAAAQELAGGTLLWSSVKAAPAAGASASAPRFQRVRYGVYRTARSQSLQEPQGGSGFPSTVRPRERVCSCASSAERASRSQPSEFRRSGCTGAGGIRRLGRINATTILIIERRSRLLSATDRR